jgi:uncharacterized membrane protein
MLELLHDKKYTDKLILFLVVICAVVLRFYDLGGESYWYDEIIMVRVAQDNIWTIVEGGRPPLYIIPSHFWIKLFGTEEFATRSLSAILGVASIPLIYLLGKELFDRKVGLIAAFLMAISQFQIYYSQDFRYYSVFVLMTLFSFLFFILALRVRSVTYFVCYVISSILMFYTHTFGVFIIVAQAIYFILKSRNYGQLVALWFLSQVLILLALLPRIINYLFKVNTGNIGPRWLPDPPYWTPLITLQNYVGAGLDYPSWQTLTIGFLFFFFGILLFALWKGKDRWVESVGRLSRDISDLSTKRDELLLIGLWLLVPILLPFILSKILRPMYHYRYTIAASPALYLFLALAIAKFRKVIPELISVGLILIVIAPGLHEFYVAPVREQWREAAKYVEDNSTIDDVIIFADAGKDQNRATFNWYYRGDLSECGINKHLKDYAAIDKEFVKCMKDTGRFWFVVREVPSPAHYLTEFFLSNTKRNLKLIRERRFTKITVYLFQMM